jgi:hypothetical protein
MNANILLTLFKIYKNVNFSFIFNENHEFVNGKIENVNYDRLNMHCLFQDLKNFQKSYVDEKYIDLGEGLKKWKFVLKAENGLLSISLVV